MALFGFLSGVLFVLYALFGYPALLLVWKRLRPRPVRKEQRYLSVSILIPVRNGEQYVRDKLESITRLRYPQELLQIVVISDGSTDRSAAIAREFPGVEVIELPPSGKCAALNRAMECATGEILLFTDIRQRLHPESLVRLLAPFADPTIGVVSGELVIVKGDNEEHANVGLYVRYEEWLRQQISAVGSVAGATGAFYAMRRRLAVPLPPHLLVDDVYQPLSAYFQGYRVILEPTAIAYDYPNLVTDEFRRKVRTLAGLYQIVGFFPQLFHPRHDIAFHFFSHKFTRLLLPYAFLLIAATSFWLPSPWNGIALSGQGAFYGLVLIDYLLPPRFPLKRVPSLCRHFVTLLAASVAATSILFRPSQTLWVTESPLLTKKP